jgi:CheY-like chemotaxis protein
MPLKVYYLDDEPELCENFADCFSSECVEVFTFTDAIKAIEFIRSQPPDILFVDFRLSGARFESTISGLSYHG